MATNPEMRNRAATAGHALGNECGIEHAVTVIAQALGDAPRPAAAAT